MESFLSLPMDERDDNNLRFVNVSKTAATALWFSSFKALNILDKSLQMDWEKRKSVAKNQTEVFIKTSETFIIKQNQTFARTC